MFKLLRQIKNNSAEINDLRNQIKNLRLAIGVLEKESRDRVTYDIIGVPYVPEYGKRELLLLEAKQRLFFNDHSQFVPAGERWRSSSVRHHYSKIASSYYYDQSSDTLYIPAIGVGGHFFAGSVPIYSRGIWADLKLTQ